MITTRDALLALITATYGDFKTVYTGYPLLIRIEDIVNDGSKRSGLAVYCKREEANWKSTGYNETLLVFNVEIYVDATRHDETEDRGEADEEWMVNRAQGIRDLIFGTEAIAANTLLRAPITITYGEREGAVRLATLEARYTKRKAR